MLEKLKSADAYQTNYGSTLEFLGAFIAVSVVMAAVYFGGRQDGLPDAKVVTSNLAQLHIKLDNLQKSIDKKQACSTDFPVAAPNKQVP